MSYAQMEQFDFKRKIQTPSAEWHRIVLPDEVFGKIHPDYTDIRIFGITTSQDTLEAPFLLNRAKTNYGNKEVSFQTINSSQNESGYFYTFQLPSPATIDQINLSFKQKNFDWAIKLEGSQNQNEWYTILNDYRILSIQNEKTDFEYTQLHFPKSRYAFYRVLIKTKDELELLAASLSQNEKTSIALRNYQLANESTSENKETKQTVITLTLPTHLPVSRVKLNVEDAFDYYRPLIIQYVSDSVKTEKGWVYGFQTIASDFLNSTVKDSFDFPDIIAKKLQITIFNQNNQPLKIRSTEISGPNQELLVRFSEAADYYLVYGNPSESSPTYDISRFLDKIPEETTPLILEEEHEIEKQNSPTTKPLFENKIWLWIIMIVVISVLGGFSVQMMRKKGNDS